MNKAQAIAAGLSKAHKDALLGRWSWASPFEADLGENDFYRLGLWRTDYIKSGESILTPLGLAVRAVLAEAAS